jgi:plastocyanin
MKKVLAATAIAAVAAITAIPAFAGTKTVKVGDNYFVRDGHRPTVTISKGSTLKFVWRGHSPHNVVKKKGPGGRINSGVKTKGTFRHRFTRGGTYTLYCSIHGLSDMGLTVKVR